MGFDLPSFGAGTITGVIGSAVGYQAWKQYQAMRTSASAPERNTSTGKSVDNPYSKALIDFCQHHHLMGHHLNLSNLLVEPRFIRMAEMVTLPDEDDILRSVFDQVPRVHDYPSLHAPYHIPTISIDDLSRGERHLALVGNQGSGRTTALMAIALWSLEQVNFDLPLDPVQQELNEAEKDLTAEERAERIKHRVGLMQRGLERYAEEKKKDRSEVSDPGLYEAKDNNDQRPTFRDREPIYVHLANVLPYSGEYGRRVDPAEPLIKALQEQLGWLAAKRMVGQLYRLLKSGNALLLIDGLDDIPVEDQSKVLDWLQAFMKLYDRNAIIITTPFDCYGTISQMGIVPVFLRPWSSEQVRGATNQWATHWETISERPLVLAKDDLENYVAHAHIHHRAQPAFELSLTLWTKYAGREGDQSQHIQHYLADRLPDAHALMPKLQHLAVMQLNEGYIQLKRLVDIATNEILAVSRADLKAQTNDEGEPLSEDDIDKALAKEERQLRHQFTQENADLLKPLVDSGLLLHHRNGRYQFQHAFIAGYLAAQSLIEADETTLIQTLQNPNWQSAIPYVLQQRPIDGFVAQKLAAPMDVLYNNVLELTRWLPYAGTRAAWRGQVLQYLGNLMVADNQFALLRERIAAALISSRDTGGLIVFRRALHHPNAEVRVLGCLGVGALFDQEATVQLASMVVQDPNEQVQIAATLALGAFGTEKALINLAEFLQISESANVRRAAAESFAAYPDMGYPTLHDALREKDMLLRRAVVFGLGRVPAPWALIDLNKTYLEDDEWYVRIAAQVALGEIYETSLKGVHHYPDLRHIEWLETWRADQVERGNIPYDIEGMDVLDQALKQTGDPLVQALAVLTIGQIGLYDKMDTLYESLRARPADVRDASYRALAMFQNQLSEPLPAPA